ncbi:bifunctional pyr operon transcriptional regulator/uracil phosphoribosyltransferase PyrR [Lacihabitans sp. LS3-19]|uniref:bifunctional pyr operon transcriptional regulator/uracil phosphoribosyltransferase PyrR n=1 Tax=Lacihabitans sp. LS3-19 TaxID=2487335 RepID=UPI0020CE4F08|nr:bifunctional pyr operon transcriptional regulator/uracil phosphoribosyltransferase PyrR [Lacihabitans sp. LS3-19]MCP9770801.1 bifunctional pyr operon transcriptional regulator/uracil phosphoribosyltransferase PyrR [Lacihabitans sp. LS3-19]
MQKKRLILDQPLLDITIKRLCQEIIENHDPMENTVLIGLQPRGIFLADRIKHFLKEDFGVDIPLGYLDATFYRDDFKRNGNILKPNSTEINFIIEDKNVILVDDVLATGRMVRAAIDAMQAFGRPEKVELLCLIDRKYNRDLPIQANFAGKKVNTLDSQRVLVEWTDQGHEKDSIWLID